MPKWQNLHPTCWIQDAPSCYKTGCRATPVMFHCKLFNPNFEVWTHGHNTDLWTQAHIRAELAHWASFVLVESLLIEAGIMCIISWQGCQRCQGCHSFGNLFTFNYVHHFMASLSELPKLPEVWQPLHFLLCASEISEIFVRYGMEGQEIRGGYEWPWVQDA